jgi:hypothetical protein
MSNDKINYKKQIEDKTDRMLTILTEMNDTSKNISDELSQQSEIFDKIEKTLEETNKNLSISEKIINRMYSFFSFFILKTEESKKVNDIPTEKKSLSETVDESINTNNTDDDKFNDVLKYLSEIKSQAITHGKILDDHNKRSQKIISGVEQNSNKIKKISDKMEKI